MPSKPTGRPPGRPKTKDYETLLARVPSNLADKVKRYATLHRQSVSELIRDGLEMRLEAGEVPGRSPLRRTDNGHTLPIPESGDTVLQELSPMLRAAIAAAVRETLDHVQGRPLHTVLPVLHGEHGEGVIQQPASDVLQRDAGENQHSVEALEAEHTMSATTEAFPHDRADTFDPTPALDYDPGKFYLGKLCPKGHDFQGTGMSLLRRHNNGCRECENQAKREKRTARRTAAAREGQR